MDHALVLFGTSEPAAPARVLAAGALTATLEAGSLRHIRLGGHEALRAIACVVRDCEWGTCASAISDLSIRAEATEAPAAGSTNGGAATEPGGRVFLAELAYSGVFTLSGLPDNTIEPVLLVECPRILFPFARNVLAEVTREGGFPPVLLQPIDFVALWQSRRAQAQAAAQQAQTPPTVHA